jgi:ABC-type multidrug transport system ATPase subunit
VNGAAIGARGLARRYGPVVALHPLDLDVPAGRLLAVLGANGAGKSTLLRLLSGLARPSAGSVAIGEAGGDRRARRARVGVVAHETLLYPALTARENLIFAGRLFRLAEPARRAEELLGRLELGAVADRPSGTFSRGTAQRVAIARALVHDPPVLLLDEPFSGLDARSGELVEELLRGLAGRRTVVLASHDLARAGRLADLGLLLAAGCGRALDGGVLRDPEALAAVVARA